MGLIVNGFAKEVMAKLPMEYLSGTEIIIYQYKKVDVELK